MQVRLTPRLAFLMTLPPLMWAGNAVVGRLMAGQIPPLQLNLMRWTLALLLLLPLGWSALATADKRRALWARRHWLFVLGLLGVGAYNALQYVALNTSTPLNVTLIAASSPMWMMAIGAAVYGERPTGASLAAAASSLCGVVVVLTRGELGRLGDLQFVLGDLLMIGATISWCFYSWMLSRPPQALQSGIPKQSEDWAGFLLVQTLFGIGWAGMAAGVEAALSSQHIIWSTQVVMALAFVAVCPSVIAYRCWGLGVAQMGPAVAAFFGNLTPLFAALLQTALLGDAPQPFHMGAFALIVLGIVVSAWRR